MGLRVQDLGLGFTAAGCRHGSGVQGLSQGMYRVLDIENLASRVHDLALK